MSSEFKKRIITSITVFLISSFLIAKGDTYYILFLILVFFVSFFEWFNLSKNIITFILGVIFLIFSFITAYFMRIENITIFIYVILISITSDIGGYVFGKLFKGPKLTKISPNKTYSGVLGSYIFSIISAIFYVNYLESYLLFSELKFFLVNHILIFITFLISTINQLGDLTISYFKRLKNVDDTGMILPGHGGVLDRIDGLIFVIPFVYLLELIII